MKGNAKALKAAVLFALLSTNFVFVSAKGIETQAEADTAINTVLNTSDVTYKDTSDLSTKDTMAELYNVKAKETVSITGAQDNTKSLTFDIMYTDKTKELHKAYNVYSSNQKSPITIDHIKNLTMNLATSDDVTVIHDGSANIAADSSGNVEIRGGVKELNLSNSVLKMQKQGEFYWSGYNVMASQDAKVTILSPTVKMATAGEGAINVQATGGTIYLGNENTRLQEITLKTISPKPSNQVGLATIAAGNQTSHIYVNADKLTIENESIGVRSSGRLDDTGSDAAAIYLGSEKAPIKTIAMYDTKAGLAAINEGSIHTVADKIKLETTDNGIFSMDGGHQVISTGVGDGEGLFIVGKEKSDGQEKRKITTALSVINRNRNLKTKASIHIAKGNLDVRNAAYALQAIENGRITAGEATKPINDIILFNNDTALSMVYDGEIKLYANRIILENNTTSISGGSGTIELHGIKELVVTPKNESTYAIYSGYDGKVSINTDKTDGTTKIDGSIFTQVRSATTMSLHTGASHLKGNIFDEKGSKFAGADGKTTLELSNMAYWAIDDDFTREYDGEAYVSWFDTLQINQGVVDFGAATAKATVRPNYKHMAIKNLRGDKGLFTFRTNLEESAKAKTVKGHGDLLTLTDSSEGNHQIMINDFSKNINQSVANGYVLLVEDKSQNGKAVFTGQADLQNGGLFTRKAIITNQAPDAALGYTDTPTAGRNWYVTMTGDPITPDKPVTPDKPDKPVTPDKPDKPVTPDKPDKPVTPDKPDKPVTPDKPDKPVTPDKPDKPVTPDKPDKPVTPDKPDKPVTPDKPDKPVTPNTPNKLTDNAKQNIAFANSRYSAIWLEESTLRKRLGDIRNDVASSGIWSEVRHGQFNSDGILNTSHYTIYELGYDRELKNTDQRKEVVGASFHYIDTDFNSMYMGHDSGINSYVFTAYDTKLFNNGNYLDLVGKVGRVKGKMDGMGTFKEDAKWSSNMYSLSAEYGRKIASSSSNWYWEPQVQLRYTYLGAADYMSSQGTAASLDSVQSVIMRAGFTVGKKHNNFDYYGKVFLNHEFAGDTAYSFIDKNKDSLSGEYDFSATWLTIGGGMQWQLSKDMYAYGEVETNINGKLEKNYEWNLGLRYSFN